MTDERLLVCRFFVQLMDMEEMIDRRVMARSAGQSTASAKDA